MEPEAIIRYAILMIITIAAGIWAEYSRTHNNTRGTK